jgi:glycine cleavage system H protein
MSSQPAASCRRPEQVPDVLPLRAVETPKRNIEMSVPDNLRYAESHEWVRDEGDGVVTVGISEFAQEKMTELVYVELPEAASEFAAGDEIAVVESVKSASDIYAPISGTVVEANGALEDDPTLVNTAPYGDGWLFKIRVSDAADLKSMMDATAYAKLIAE